MRGAWRLGQVCGVGICVHGTFWILLGGLALVYRLQGNSVTEALTGLLFPRKYSIRHLCKVRHPERRQRLRG